MNEDPVAAFEGGPDLERVDGPQGKEILGGIKPDKNLPPQLALCPHQPRQPLRRQHTRSIVIPA